jgi:hypothetical protein
MVRTGEARKVHVTTTPASEPPVIHR